MSPSILLIDNYDSFVFNLARYFNELGCDTQVVRNDAVSVDEIRLRAPAAIVLSPGPCTPQQSGICLDVVRELETDVPMLGVCLGHQAIAAALGGRIVRAAEPMHGRTSKIAHNADELFDGLPDPLTAARYHSLVVDESFLPDSLSVTARTSDGTIMAFQHHARPIVGVQFHPESILTDDGHRLLHNFLKLAGVPSQLPPFQERTPQPAADDDFFQQSIHHNHSPPLPT